MNQSQPGGIGRNHTRMHWIGIPVAVLLASVVANAYAAEGTTREALATNTLRVCADPSNLPFSNDAGEGFENKIVELVARELGVKSSAPGFPRRWGSCAKPCGCANAT